MLSGTGDNRTKESYNETRDDNVCYYRGMNVVEKVCKAIDMNHRIYEVGCTIFTYKIKKNVNSMLFQMIYLYHKRLSKEKI